MPSHPGTGGATCACLDLIAPSWRRRPEQPAQEISTCGTFARQTHQVHLSPLAPPADEQQVSINFSPAEHINPGSL